jgi:hypothetical protein
MNEIEEGLNEWGDIPHSWVRWLSKSRWWLQV